METSPKKAGYFSRFKMIFEIIDKTGRKVRLTKERWKHITFPTSPHSYMTNYLGEIKQTLIN